VKALALEALRRHRLQVVAGHLRPLPLATRRPPLPEPARRPPLQVKARRHPQRWRPVLVVLVVLVVQEAQLLVGNGCNCEFESTVLVYPRPGVLKRIRLMKPHLSLHTSTVIIMKTCHDIVKRKSSAPSFYQNTPALGASLAADVIKP
jgi:hypothetical protein